jgi:hypothetical protein
MSRQSVSVVAIVGGLTAFGLMALAAVLFIQPGSEAEQRLALFFGLLSIVVTSLVGMLKADQSAKQTNGSLDARIHDAVLAAMSSRRASDIVPDDARKDERVP